MTPQEIIKEFRSYNAVEQLDLISKRFQVARDNLETNGKTEADLETRMQAFERLAGALKMDKANF